ncbi:hypothetical protein HQQ81_01185 [Microbacteriaceae bacterium VKM Ac-2854]|nr:hypothetical protein [Microbacteriaceae bacterium VKM Ac-2854]
MSAVTGRARMTAPQSVAGLVVAMTLATAFTGSIAIATLAGAHHLPWLLAAPFLLAVLILPLAFAPGPGRWGHRTTGGELLLCFAVDAAALLAMVLTAATSSAAPALILGALQIVALLWFTVRIGTRAQE